MYLKWPPLLFAKINHSDFSACAQRSYFAMLNTTKLLILYRFFCPKKTEKINTWKYIFLGHFSKEHTMKMIVFKSQRSLAQYTQPSSGTVDEIWLRVRMSNCQFQICNSPGFNPSILRHSGI
jgi:hypothetical protein